MSKCSIVPSFDGFSRLMDNCAIAWCDSLDFRSPGTNAAQGPAVNEKQRRRHVFHSATPTSNTQPAIETALCIFPHSHGVFLATDCIVLESSGTGIWVILRSQSTSVSSRRSSAAYSAPSSPWTTTDDLESRRA